MHSVNNGLTMSNNSDANEIALERLRNILIAFEKKKRNLEKRKNKLDEYKKKDDLNEDQLAAVSKYSEVMSNLEMLEELTTHAVQQLTEAEKSIKKAKKQEMIDRKKCETQLSEFVLRSYCALERVRCYEPVRHRLVLEAVLSEEEMDKVLSMCTEIRKSDNNDWRHCSEQLCNIYTGVCQEKKALLLRLCEIEWLWSDQVDTPKEECVLETVEITEPECLLSVVLEQEPIPTVESLEKANCNPNLSFVFLHDSTVQNDSHSDQNDHVEPPIATVDKIDDVFCDATKSEFMIKENAWGKRAQAPINGRAWNRTSVPPSSQDGLMTNEGNCWKTTKGGFNQPNQRFGRNARGRGRNNGNFRTDNRSTVHPLV